MRTPVTAQDLPDLPEGYLVMPLKLIPQEPGLYAISLKDAAHGLGRTYEVVRRQVINNGITRYRDPDDPRAVVIDWHALLTLVRLTRRTGAGRRRAT